MNIRHILLGAVLSIVFFFLTGIAEGMRLNQLSAAGGSMVPSHIIGLAIITVITSAALVSVHRGLRSTAAPLAFAIVLAVLMLTAWAVSTPMGVMAPMFGFYWFETASRAANSLLTAGALGASVAAAVWSRRRDRVHEPRDVASPRPQR